VNAIDSGLNHEPAPYNAVLTFFLACLATLNFPEMNYRQLEVQNTRANSYTWIVQHPDYTKWVKDRHGLLWIKGKPGSGKSTLMKKIFQLSDEDKDHTRLAFFFHRRGTSLQHTQIGMFRTLLYQLLKQVPSVGTEFKSLYEDKERYGKFGRDWDWNVIELRQIFKSALLAAAKTHHIRVFIDALDEAGEESARAVVSFLYELNDSLLEPEVVTSICFSCRHFPIVTTNDGFQICVEDENHEDIEAYVLGELRRRLHISAQGSKKNDDLEDLRTDIASKASGVFLWATLVVDLVVRQYNKGKPLKTIRQALQRVPPLLNDIFGHILLELVDPEERIQSLHLMQWICLAERPLSLTELRFAMASDDSSIQPSQYSCQDSEGFIEDNDQMRKRIVSLSGGLAEVKHRYDEDTVQFIHQSVNDFLAAAGFRHLDPTSTEDLIGLGHHRLSRSCINYLKLGEVLREDRMWDISIIQELPFIKYATKSWFLHAEKAESRGISQQELVQQFKFPRQVFGTWVKIYGVVDKYSDKCPEPGSTLLHTASSLNLRSTVRVLLQEGIYIEGEDAFGNRALHHAARWGHKELASMLLDAHAEIGAKNEVGGTPLEWAAGNGHEEVVKLLLSRGANVNESTGTSGNALQAAALEGSATLTRTLMESGAEVNAQGGEYGNALQAAAYNGHKAVVQLLIDKGVEVNAQGGVYGNALQAAARWGYKTVVQLLLDKGAEVNAQGGEYGNALQAAAYNGSEAIVELLLDKGAEVNTQGGEYGNALQAAAYNGDEVIVQLLLDKRAEINAQGGEYGNALQAAAYNGYKAIVQPLIDKGSEVNAQGGRYGNALQAAAYNGHEAVVQLLLDKGAELNAQGGQYGNALQAAARWDYKTVVQLLLDKGAEVNAQGGMYGNALQAAAYDGHEAVIQLLLDKGAEVNAEGGEYGNALQAAAYNGHEAIIHLLLNKGAEVNAQGGEYDNALQAAAYNGSEAVIQLLLDKGAEVNAQGGEYGNALQAAAYNGHEAIIQLLLNRGAEVNAQGGEYDNALQAAAYNGSEAVIQLLLDKGAEVNAQGGQYGNALQAAVCNGHEAIVQLLLDKGAEVNAQSGTAVHTAADECWERGLELLLSRILNFEQQDNHGWTAYAVAWMNRNDSICRTLSKYGCSSDISESSAGLTPDRLVKSILTSTVTISGDGRNAMTG
jgi:ankyrin repeat protein